jgi:hypothetical protein
MVIKDRSGRECGVIGIVLLLLVLAAQVLKHRNDTSSDRMGGEVSESLRLAPKYQAQTEVLLPDRTRCDLVNAEYAIEVEYPKKWAESIGQSLYYGIELKRKPAVLFLTRGPDDLKYIRRAMVVAQQHGIKIYEEQVP